MTNSKSTKRALLTSALAILMCLAMLIGTTFAWFTDTASTSVNTIQAGTLDVALEMWDGEKWVNAEGETLNFKAADNRTDILWEPGCTYELPALRIVNKGNLALKYKVIITGINGDAKLNDVIDWKVVFPVDEAFWDNTDSRELVYDLDFWYGPNDGQGPDPSNPSTLLPNGVPDFLGNPNDTNEFTIRGHMQKTAGNEYQGLSIDGIAITVCATQYTYEKDSNNNQYDKNATYDTEAVTAAELKAILTAEGEVKLQKNYVVTDAWTAINLGVVGSPLSVNIDGQGHTIYGLSDALVSCEPNASVAIKNLTISGAHILGDTQAETNGLSTAAFVAYADNCEGLVLDNCHVVNSTIAAENYMEGDSLREPRAAGLVGYVSKSSTAPASAAYEIKNCTVRNCKITGSNGAAGVLALVSSMSITIDSCEVKGNTAITCTENRGGGAAKAGYLVGTVSGSAATLTIKNATVDSTVTLTNVNAQEPANGGLVGRNVDGTVNVE